MNDLYSRYKKILDKENKKIIDSKFDDGVLILDVVDIYLNEYRYLVCEEDGVIAALVCKKDFD